MAVSYARDIRPLIRDDDISCMKDFGFDLGDLGDVRRHAGDIYERLADKTMPEDGPWSDENIARFRQWMDEGMAE